MQRVKSMGKKLIVVIDGQGGGLGKSIIEQLLAANVDCEIVAVGTNALATNTMIKAGATHGVTGENAVVYNAMRADIVLGPIGIATVNGLLGEVSLAMANAVGQSNAVKVLLPSSKCNLRVAGTKDVTLSRALQELVLMVKEALQN